MKHTGNPMGVIQQPLRLLLPLLIGIFTVFGTRPAFAVSCTYVAIDAATEEVFETATGHGPRGCIRAKRRCERRANQDCVPEGNVHTKRCSANAQTAINQAFEFIRSHSNQLKNDFELDDRRLQRRKIRRRFDRKINRTRVGCATGVLCRTNQEKRVGLHAWGIAGNKIRLCYEKMVEVENFRFCDLVDTVAHEFGHSIGIKKDRAGGHGRNGNDRVYRFGWFARGLCESELSETENFTLMP